MELTVNMNDKVTIYPNESGWARMIVIIMSNSKISVVEARSHVYMYKTEDGGYKNQLWVTIQDFHSMFFNGQAYFEHSNIKFTS